MSKRLKNFLHFFLSPERLLLVSFLFTIIVGTFLLKLPFATKAGHIATIDALFTSASAVCVTGLVVVDTGSFFTDYGQIIILCLIQAGGLGIITFSMLFYRLLGMDIPLKGKIAMEETFTYEPVKNIFNIIKSVFIYTIIIEGTGFLVLFLRWSQSFPVKKALYISIFHSISAFCNAGFSTFTESLTAFRGDWWVNLTLLCLIISGGIGFVVLREIHRKIRWGLRFSLHTKVVLLMTAILITGGTLLFFLTEYENVLTGLLPGEKIITCLFQSVTARTTGFNTVEIGQLNNATLFIFILLMFIGASPGSCGGGIKTTNLAILLSLSYNLLKRRFNAVMFKRTIPQETVVRSISLMIGSIMFLVLMLVIFLIIEEGNVSHLATRGVFLESLFELTSAFGTVGLSTGLTSYLDAAGKALVIITMFIGRLGLLTLTFSLAKMKAEGEFLYGEENVIVG